MEVTMEIKAESGREEKEKLLSEWFGFVDSINALLKGDNG